LYHKLVKTARTGLTKPARTKTEKCLLYFQQRRRLRATPHPKHHCGSQRTVCLVPSLGYPTSEQFPRKRGRRGAQARARHTCIHTYIHVRAHPQSADSPQTATARSSGARTCLRAAMHASRLRPVESLAHSATLRHARQKQRLAHAQSAQVGNI
jgi:hypothetical protein